MSKASSLKVGFVDLAAALFVIGGVISLIISALTIPISSIYPFTVGEMFSYGLAIVFIVSLVCSLGAIHCYSFTSKRLLSQAGIRGIIFGAILLALSLGFIGAYHALNATVGAVSAVLVLVAGAICFVLRESILPSPPLVQMLPQRTQQH